MKMIVDPTDRESLILKRAYGNGANRRANTSQPCSFCRQAELDIKAGNVEEGESIRTHFHTSELPRCMLQVRNDMVRGKNREPMKGRSAAHLGAGHAFEAETFKNLDMGGLKVIPFANHESLEKVITVFIKEIDSDPDDGLLTRDFRFSKDHEDKLDGDKKKEFETAFKVILHLDGIMEMEDELAEDGVANYGLEHKAVSTNTWRKILDTSEISDEWYGQVQGYFMWGQTFGIQTFFLIVLYRDTSDIRIFRIPRNDKYINKRLNVLYRIYMSIVDDEDGDGMEKYGIEREYEKKSCTACKFCDYNKECYPDGSESIDVKDFKPGLKEEKPNGKRRVSRVPRRVGGVFGGGKGKTRDSE